MKLLNKGLRKPKKWKKYVQRNVLKGPAKRIERQLGRLGLIAGTTGFSEKGKKKQEQLWAFSEDKRRIKFSKKILFTIVIDTAMKRFNFNKTFSPREIGEIRKASEKFIIEATESLPKLVQEREKGLNIQRDAILKEFINSLEKLFISEKTAKAYGNELMELFVEAV